MSKCAIHKYSRFKMGKDKSYIVMRCVNPSCTHYISEKLAVGKWSICFKCGEQFILGPMDLKLKPTCECNKKKRSKPIESQIDSFLDEILK